MRMAAITCVARDVFFVLLRGIFRSVAHMRHVSLQHHDGVFCKRASSGSAATRDEGRRARGSDAVRAGTTPARRASNYAPSTGLR